MNSNNRSDISRGMRVNVVRKEDQRSGALTEGVVRDLLTKSSYHPHGIKVRLEGRDRRPGERNFGKRRITKHVTQARKKPRTSQIFVM